MKTLKFLTDNELKALDKIKKTLKNAEIYVFGSKVRGDFDDESDLDVLIVIPNTINKYKVINLITYINLKFETNISPIVLTQSNFLAQKDFPVLKQILNTSIKV